MIDSSDRRKKPRREGSGEAAEEITETEETEMLAWPVCVKPNRSNRIMARESDLILRDLISAAAGRRRKMRMRHGRRKGSFVILIGGGGTRRRAEEDSGEIRVKKEGDVDGANFTICGCKIPKLPFTGKWVDLEFRNCIKM
ncbi:unnamed protein product [Fraxinus pennsylvanica]|uniref:Uncharacterized protein n=1 Tax=Fraxinus pennsylvanica TaxID=56036 RepID=A0AAD1ZF53_9LAMI|nr:unnamed protein product [Fraxinus pennsylvanica]